LVSYDDMWKPHFMFAETITARASQTSKIFCRKISRWLLECSEMVSKFYFKSTKIIRSLLLM